MQELELIEFQKKRDFSLKLNVTFEFAKRNFKGLGSSLLFIAGPPILVASLLMSSFISDFLGMMGGVTKDPEVFSSYFLAGSFWLKIGMMFLFLMVSYVAVISTSYNYMLHYQESRGAQPEVGDIWNRVRNTMGMYIGTTFLFAILTLVLYIVALIPVAVAQTLGPFISVLGVFALMIFVIYAFVAMSFVYCIRAFEGKGFLTAIQRSFYLIRGKWWSTFGLIIILSLLVVIITYVFTLPAGIIGVIGAAHRVQEKTTEQGVIPMISYVLYALGYIVQMLLYTLPNLGIAFQYFNLVELKEAKGLMDKIDSMGSVASSEKGEEHY
jgi:hypothetical protein